MFKTTLFIMTLITYSLLSTAFAANVGGNAFFSYGGLGQFDEMALTCDAAKIGKGPIGTKPAVSGAGSLTANIIPGDPPKIAWRITGGGTSITGTITLVDDGIGMPYSGDIYIYFLALPLKAPLQLL